jgi:glycosyltransferase involved in cell wall biosynthesis
MVAQMQGLAKKAHLWAPAFNRFGGGISSFSRELALGLQGSGWALRLYGKQDRPALWSGIPLAGVGALPHGLQTAGFVSIVLAGSASYEPDSIISTHPNFGPLAHLAKKILGIPYTLIAHGVDVHAQISPARLAAMRAADQIVAVSKWTRQRVLALGGIDDQRVCVLPNTYHDTRFVVGERPEYLVQRYQLCVDEKVILTVARLDAAEGYKGYDRILQALPGIIRTCGSVRFIIAGKGSDRERLDAMASELGVAEQVSFAGFVPDEELADHYRLADVFAMPSTGEGFGIVFLEAMGCGTPVLGGNQDGSVDALDGGKLGLLVDPCSVDAIAAGLTSLLRKEGPQMWFGREQLSQAVKKTYGREAFRRRVAELFPVL